MPSEIRTMRAHTHCFGSFVNVSNIVLSSPAGGVSINIWKYFDDVVGCFCCSLGIIERSWLPIRFATDCSCLFCLSVCLFVCMFFFGDFLTGGNKWSVDHDKLVQSEKKCASSVKILVFSWFGMLYWWKKSRHYWMDIECLCLHLSVGIIIFSKILVLFFDCELF